jgi:hypothetical protein
VSSHTKEFLDQARYVIFDYEEKMNTKKEADSNKRKSKIQLKGLEQFEGNE